jgi:tRNA modification GTPase
VGKPNAGKSTLLNALLNEERAIVSEIAGTTRDTIEETLNINGILFRLIDTAGIREHSTDTIELRGMERSVEVMTKADVVIHLFDVTDDFQSQITNDNFKEGKHLLVGNKTDVANIAKLKEQYSDTAMQMVFISAKNKENIQQLKDALYALVAGGDITQEGTIVTNTRHYSALQEVLRSLRDIKHGLDSSLPGDLISLDIRRCLHYLGEITGQITTEDKLDYIFSKFCIGK